MNDKPEIVIIDTCPPWIDGIAAWLAEAGYVCHKHIVAQDIIDGAHFTLPQIKYTIAVLGLHLPSVIAFQLCRTLVQAATRCVLFCKHSDEWYVPIDACYVGAAACLPSGIEQSDFLRVIQVVAAGGRYFDAHIQAEAAQSFDLTPRELEVLAWLAQDLSDHDLAERSNRSTNTVRNQVQSILTKLNVRSRVEAKYRALHRGLVA